MSQEWLEEPLYDPGYTDSYISATQVKSYRTCPKQYWFQYETELDPTKASKGYLELGSAVHEAIEEVLIELTHLGDDGTVGSQVDDSVRKRLHSFSESELTRKFKKVYRESDPEIDDEKYSTGLDCLEVAARFLAAKQPDILGIEKKGSFALNRPDVNEKFFGKLDVTTKEAVIDWKTGSIRDDTEVEEQIQGAIYMKMYQMLYDEPPETIQFVYLKEGKLRSLEPNDETWNAMLKYARSLIRGKKSGDFTPKPSGMCYFCGYEGYCPASPAGVGDVEWERY